MKERPILFSTPMVQAILDGRKTQTRRIIKPQPNENGVSFDLRPPCLDWEQIYKESWKVWHYETDEGESIATNGKYQIGDILWVRETFCATLPQYFDEIPDYLNYHYKATHELPDGEKWKPSIFMPKEACRIKLEITNIRVEKLCDITDSDALAEGVEHVIDKITGYCGYDYISGGYNLMTTPYHGYKSLWKKINGPDSWDKNPWVWVIEFKRIQ